MNTSTSQYTDRVLQNINKVNIKVDEVYESIRNQVSSLIENNIFTKSSIKKWISFYKKIYKDMVNKTLETSPLYMEQLRLVNEFFNDSIEQINFRNDNQNKHESLSDDEIKQEIINLIENTSLEFESMLDIIFDSTSPKDVDERNIYIEILDEFHQWKKSDDLDLNNLTDKYIRYNLWTSVELEGDYDGSLSKNKNLILNIVKNFGYALNAADTSLKKDKEICIEAIKNDITAYDFIDKSLKNDKDILKLIKKSPYLKQ